MSKWKPGMFRLATDVLNPKPDLRRKHDFWETRLFKAGTLFEVFQSPHTDTPGKFVVRPVNNTGKTISTNDRRATAVVEHLTPFEAETLEEVLLLAKEGPAMLSPTEVLKRLVLSGRVTLDEVREAARRETAEQLANNNGV